ncbi:hypothetical protein PQZ65_gp56 [Klebsiella phage 1611E-K2-1]|nr:hypothetical protein PQZ65_gp56 [Klebsiella phage 1611E-K2-1]
MVQLLRRCPDRNHVQFPEKKKRNPSSTALTTKRLKH